MKSLRVFFTELFGLLLLALQRRIPFLSSRRAVNRPFVTVVLVIILLLIIGGVAYYLIEVLPTVKPYP